ncbi:MAG: hypothetical protein GF330_09340 [Candidatus Eisenbacteria bacterium]|nr:hypothetical protein [Candidatus Eisenbacteria bacterium]
MVWQRQVVVGIASLAMLLACGVSGCGGDSTGGGPGRAASETSTAEQPAGNGQAARRSPPAAGDPQSTAEIPAGKGLTALEEAAAAGEYVYVFFYTTEDEETRTMRSGLAHALRPMEGKVRVCEIDANDPAESGVVSRLGASGAPMPLVLAVAPNGAVTGGFPQRASTPELLGAMVGPRTAACLKALQNRKIVLACIQNPQTAHNEEAMQGVRDFMADARFAPLTESVLIDPSDPEEQNLLNAVKVDPTSTEAITVVMVPPATALGQITGPTDKTAIEKVLRSRPTACTPGGACCPK